MHLNLFRILLLFAVCLHRAAICAVVRLSARQTHTKFIASRKFNLNILKHI